MPTANRAIVLARFKSDRWELLLLKNKAGWDLPQLAEAQTPDTLLEHLQAGVFAQTPPCKFSIMRNEDFSADEAGPALVLISAGELHPFIEDEHYLDAKWASFEEVFYAARTNHDDVLELAKRALRKAQKQL